MVNTEKNTDFADLSSLVEADGVKDVKAVYEVGYHLAPTLSEDAVSGEAETFKKAIEKVGGEIVGERVPTTVHLAYPVEKVLDGARRAFDQAYFGWIAFELEGAKLVEVDSVFKRHAQVLRHLIITTNRDVVASVMADPALDVPPAHMEEVLESMEEAPAEAVVESVGADSDEEKA